MNDHAQHTSSHHVLNVLVAHADTVVLPDLKSTSSSGTGGIHRVTSASFVRRGTILATFSFVICSTVSYLAPNEVDPKAGETTQYVLIGEDFRLMRFSGLHIYVENDLGPDSMYCAPHRKYYSDITNALKSCATCFVYSIVYTVGMDTTTSFRSVLRASQKSNRLRDVEMAPFGTAVTYGMVIIRIERV